MDVTTEQMDRFWEMIDRVAARSEGDLDASCAAFRDELYRLDDARFADARNAFSFAMMQAYDHGLWGSAYLIHGGCSDDAFWDFRAGLVALGRRTFDAALAAPDSLADVPDIEDRTVFEGFQYVPEEVAEARGLVAESPPHGPQDREPTGTPWDEADLERRFPRLWERFG